MGRRIRPRSSLSTVPMRRAGTSAARRRRRLHSRGSSIEECPGICAVKAPDDHRFQQLRLEVAQVHSVPSARLGFQWLPVGNDAARLAAHVPQRPITPDVVFRVLGMTLNGHCSELVVGPNASRATAERAIAARSLVWRNGKSKANGSAMAGAVKRWCWLFVTHVSNLCYCTLILPKTSISPLSFTRPTTRSPESISSIVSKSMFGLWLTNATGLGPLRLPISD